MQTIDPDELEQLLDKSGLLFSKKQVQEILNTIDTDDTGTLDFMECLEVTVLKFLTQVLRLYNYSLVYVNCYQQSVAQCTLGLNHWYYYIPISPLDYFILIFHGCIMQVINKITQNRATNLPQVLTQSSEVRSRLCCIQ